MWKLIAKSVHLFLIAVFMFQYGEVYLPLKSHLGTESSVPAGCGCDMRICCCSETVNMANDVCKMTAKTESPDKSTVDARPVYVNCGSAEKTMFISAFKQILPIFPKRLLSYFSSSFRYRLRTTFFKPLEIEHSIFRPPRA